MRSNRTRNGILASHTQRCREKPGHREYEKNVDPLCVCPIKRRCVESSVTEAGTSNRTEPRWQIQEILSRPERNNRKESLLAGRYVSLQRGAMIFITTAVRLGLSKFLTSCHAWDGGNPTQQNTFQGDDWRRAHFAAGIGSVCWWPCPTSEPSKPGQDYH